MILAFVAMLAATTPEPPLEVARAASAWAECLNDRLAQAEENARPEIIADAMIEHCGPQQEAARVLHVRWINESNLSDREKASALRALLSARRK